MAKGIARQVKSWYPAAPSAIRLRYPPDICSVLIYFDPIFERYIFNLVTKFRYYHKPTYESVLASLYELREILIDAGISHLSLPKLASGYDKLDFNIMFELICQVFDPLPITIYIHQHVQTHYSPAVPSICPKSPTSLSNLALISKIAQNSKKFDLKSRLF